MKNFKFLLPFVISLIFLNCSKDDSDPAPKNYDDLKRSDIVAIESDMVTGNITTTNDSGPVWQPGDVIVYKTNEGRYGKFEILDITQAENYKLTVKCTTYTDNGSVFISTNNLIIRGTYLCDLDVVTENGVETVLNDFHWNRQTATLTYLTPKNGAKFVKYTF